jgi:hypothetical protein
VLRAGDGYVGLEELFVHRRSNFVREITDDGTLDPDETRPPRSLEQAVATFMLAMVVGQLRRAPRPASMLVHPSAGRALHDTYARWVGALRHRVERALGDGDPVLRDQLSRSMFEQPYEDLLATGGVVVDGDPVPLGELLTELQDLLPEMRVRVVNSDDGHEIGQGEWRQGPGWIVIGGNKLDRGFTVENLIVTYMPRGAGVGNADTVQQRARFLGYKRGFVDLLRGWFNPETRAVYDQYVEHERAMRAELAELDSTGTPLAEWRRSLLLERSLSPTRKQVVTLEVKSHLLKPGWYVAQTEVFGDAVGPAVEGAAVLAALHSRAEPDARDRRIGADMTRVTPATWDEVLPVLVEWRGTPSFRDKLYGLVIAVNQTAVGDLPVEVLFMNGGGRRTRSADASAEARIAAAGNDLDAVLDLDSLAISGLMQGADPADGSVYPGDRALMSSNAVTIQVHNLVVKSGGSIVGEPTALAIHLPAGVSQRVILQE